MNERPAMKIASLAPPIRSAKMGKILDCAEREFAAHGYSATPLHRIAKAARVNQALINYYFGSKVKLYQAVFLRRGLQLSRERLRLLDELSDQGPGQPSVELLIQCFVSPAIKLMYEENGGKDFLRLQARLQSEPKDITRRLRAAVYDEATRRFIEKFQSALPHVDRKAIVWRMVMMIGAYLYIVSDASRLEQLSDGSCDVKDQADVIGQLAAFFTGGFKYPAPETQRRGVKSTFPQGS